MIKLRDNLLVQAHMIVSIELSTDAGKPCIDVYTPDGQYWAITAEELHVPEINETLLIALGNEIDRQCREIGAAGVMSDQVKRAIERGVDLLMANGPGDWSPVKPLMRDQRTGDYNRQLDDEIPF